ncbi:hypothetical protein BT63DRAFT_479784 [Microthyrium microscopicum]|uniref:Tat pathway signal sequence n=1 Tax=Microthyrium microscopicum TaxID=703497 RepID=A0A6A6U7Z1_9PEZI|nr:hypothetical protein BT63DRAFT_479784 [Microthyrium microscopicum]
MSPRYMEESKPLRVIREDFSEDDQSDTEVDTPTREGHYLYSHSRSDRFRNLFFFAAASCFLLGIVVLALLFRLWHLEKILTDLAAKQLEVNEQKPGFATDFEQARQYIDFEQKVFSGGIVWNNTAKDFWYERPANEPRYFGNPAVYPEIDKNWANILKDEFFSLTDEEAKPFAREDFVKIKGENKSGNYFAAVGVVHGLHCVNALRINMFKDYYTSIGKLHQDGPQFPPHFSEVHMEHCLDYVRQVVECHGDLTPIPLYKQEGAVMNGEQMYIAHGGTHTCRNFNNIRHWLKRRRIERGTLSEYHENGPHAD